MRIFQFKTKKTVNLTFLFQVRGRSIENCNSTQEFQPAACSVTAAQSEVITGQLKFSSLHCNSSMCRHMLPALDALHCVHTCNNGWTRARYDGLEKSAVVVLLQDRQ